MSTEALLKAIDKGHFDEVVTHLGALTDDERRGCRPEVERLLKDLESRPVPNRHQVHLSAVAARIACQTGAVAAAKAITGGRRWAVLDASKLMRVIGVRDPGWYVELTERLAASGRDEDWHLVPLVLALTKASDRSTVEVGDEFVGRWVRHYVWDRRRTRTGPGLLAAVRADPYLDVCVARLFDAPDAGAHLHESIQPYTSPSDGGWPTVLRTLTDEGRLDRASLIRGCLTKMLRGDTTAGMRGWLLLHDALDPSMKEQAAHALYYVRMLPTAPGPIAGRAQRILFDLDAEGLLEPELLVEATRELLFRPEKKLAAAQLSGLAKLFRRDPSRKDELLEAVAEAADTNLLPESLLVQAFKLLGRPDPRTEAPAPEVRPDELPEPPRPEVLDPVTDLAELARLLEHVVREAGRQPAAERCLDGIVRLAFTDPGALEKTLAPVQPQQLAHIGMDDLLRPDLAVRYVSHALAFGFVPETPAAPSRRYVLNQLIPAMRERIREIIANARTRPIPCLLSLPTWNDGRIAPSELVTRLELFHANGSEPWPNDLDTALLRLDVNADGAAEARGRAAALPGEAARRVTAWLDHGGIGPETLPDLGERYRAGLTDTSRSKLRFNSWWLHVPALTMLLPAYRERLAVILDGVLAGSGYHDWYGADLVLDRVAPLSGPAGPATHRALANALGCENREARLRAVDRMLLLAAQGVLDPDPLAVDLAALAAKGTATPQRLASDLTEAATRAPATVWRVLRPLIPALLAVPDLPPRGMPTLLALATDCLRRSGSRAEPVPGLDGAATRRGRVGEEARRLAKVLAGS